MRLRGRKLTASSFKQDTFFYGTSTIAERCVSILIIPLLTKTLSQEVYGIWTQMIITAGLISPIVLMGFPMATVQFLTGKKAMRETSSTFHGMVGIVLSNSFLVMAIAFAFSPSLSRIMFGDARFSEFVYVFGLFLTVQALFEMAIAFLRARKEIRLLSLYYFLQNGGRIGILALGILLLQINLFYAIVCIVVAQLILSIFIYIRDILKKVGFNVAIRKTRWKEILSFSLPLIPYSLLIWTNNFVSRYFILHILNINEVSVYAVAYSLAAVTGIFYSILGFTLYPHMAHLWNEGNRIGAAEILNNAMKYYLFFTIPFIAILTILSTPLITVVSTVEYVSNWRVILWLGVGIGVFGLYELNVFIILLAKKTLLNLKISAVALAVNIILNIIMIPKTGILGAAIATFLSNSVLAVWTIAIGKNHLPYLFPWHAFAKIVFATIVISLFLSTVMHYVDISNIYRLMSTVSLAIILYGLIDLLGKHSLLRQLMRNV